MGAGPDRVTLSDITLPGNTVLEQRYLTVTNAHFAGDLTVFSRADTTISDATIIEKLVDFVIRSADHDSAQSAIRAAASPK